MTEKNTNVADQIKAKAAEIESFLNTLQPANPVDARILASAKRDIAGGFQWALRAVAPDQSQ